MVRFGRILGVLARFTCLPVFAEGYPLRDSVTDQETVSRLESVLQSQATDAATIQVLANAFDYQAEVTAEAILLRKRFTQLDDLPELSFAECMSILEQITEILNSVLPAPIDAREAILQLLKEASEEQKATLIAGYSNRVSEITGGLPVPSFSVAHQDLLRRLAFSQSYYRTAPQIQEGLAFLQKITQDDTTIGLFEQNVGSLHLMFYGLELSRAGGLPPIHYPIDNHLRPDFNGCISFQPEKLGGPPGGILLSSDTETVEIPVGESPKDQNVVAPITVAAFVSWLRQVGAPAYQVDAKYASKTLCIFGNANVNSDAQFRSVANLLGLHLLKSRDGTVRLTGKGIRNPVNIQGLPAAVTSALPDTLTRYLDGRKTALSPVFGDAPPHLQRILQSAPQIRERTRQRLQQSAYDSAKERVPAKVVEQLRVSLVRKLLAVLAREYRLPGEKTYVSELDTIQKDWIGQLCFSQCLAAINKLTRPVPSLITHLNEAIVHAGPTEDQGHPSYFLALDIATPESPSRSGICVHVPQSNSLRI